MNLWACRARARETHFLILFSQFVSNSWGKKIKGNGGSIEESLRYRNIMLTAEHYICTSITIL